MSLPAEQREALIGLTNLSSRDLRALRASLESLSAEAVRDALTEILPALADEYGSAAAALAADWYDERRDEARAPGRFVAEPARLPDDERFRSLASWGTGPLFQPEPDLDAALTLVAGGMQRTVSDMHRLTVVESTQRDPKATGWRRIGVGTNCGFCRMLIDRGHVYTKSSVTFRSHDHCNCAASPVWANVAKVSREPFRQSQKNRSDATKAKDNARARAFLADEYGH